MQLSTIVEAGTSSDMNIGSSMEHSPSPLLFHIDLQDNQKKSSPIPIPDKLLPIDDLFEQNHKPQLAQKTVPFTKLPHPMEEIWVEYTAQQAEEEDGKEITLAIIAGNNGFRYILDDWSLLLHLITWDSPSATKYMAADIFWLPLTLLPMLHLEEDSKEVDSIIRLVDTYG